MAFQHLHPPVLLIGATDSSGGAGLGQDIVAVQFASQFLGRSLAYRLAVSSVTVQTSAGVVAVQPVPVSVFEKQLWASIEDTGLSAIKIGMLSGDLSKDSVSHIDVLVDFLQNCRTRFGEIPVILDPVFKASSGGNLQNSALLQQIQQKLLPFVRVLTPNLTEFQTLQPHLRAKSEYSLHDIHQNLEACSSWGISSVLLKGGHLILEHQHNKVVDVLAFFQKNSMELASFSRPRRPFVTDRRGTGCFLATTLAVCLSQYEDHTFETISKAVEHALTIFDAYHA